MLTYQGQYASCVVHTDEIEEEAVKQIYGFLNHPAFENLTIRVMPDVHAGAGAVIGFTSTLGPKIIPNVIGVDIACGMLSLNIGKKTVDLAELDKIIHENVPAGFNRHSKNMVKNLDTSAIEKVAEDTEQDVSSVLQSIGTLGGGNHFIELGIDQNEDKWLTIHSGSRNFGLKIALYHQRIAKAKNSYGDLSYLEGEDASKYVEHMKTAYDFAMLSRTKMAATITELAFGRIIPVESIHCIHNYIDFKRGVIRKGAISAQEGERVVIPWNMRDGLIIGTGKGNSDWNYSAPHGAGRVMGRREAKRAINLQDYIDSMQGIHTTCVNENTIDESPFAYKTPESIERYLEPTVEITNRVRPLYNFKASGD